MKLGTGLGPQRLLQCHSYESSHILQRFPNRTRRFLRSRPCCSLSVRPYPKKPFAQPQIAQDPSSGSPKTTQLANDPARLRNRQFSARRKRLPKMLKPWISSGLSPRQAPEQFFGTTFRNPRKRRGIYSAVCLLLSYGGISRRYVCCGRPVFGML
jgi:hypothetical protein